MKSLSVFVLLFLMAPLWVQAGEISPRLEGAMAQSGPATWGVWVEFNDKGVAANDLPALLSDHESRLSPKALARRTRMAHGGAPVVDMRDIPLSPDYLLQVESTGAFPRRQSRWFNAASYNATIGQIQEIAALPCVRSVDLVSQFQRTVPAVSPDEISNPQESEKVSDELGWSLNYGGSLGAAELINLPPVHDTGLSGEGVVVAVLDAGFVLSHECFSDLSILAQWDFVHNDDSVQMQDGDHEWQDHHGGQVLSAVMGFSEGHLIGSAYGASAILAMTEDTGDETPIEEDNWVAAVEWVESLGADVVTTSLGYYYWLDYSDLDGNTALITRAADMAVSRGMAVFTSAGNERNNEDWPYVTAPADGDSVIAVGAVDLSGTVANFSSPGPTFDGRIKPDVCALGVNTYVASYYADNNYMGANGTSFAAPQVAGVAALMLERIPSLTPMQIREALRQNASQHRNPDNDKGWGFIDAMAAVSYWGATIVHEPLLDSENTTGPYVVVATITDRVALDTNNLFLHWRHGAGPWNSESLTSLGSNQFQALIPGTGQDSLVEYYFSAGDVNGYEVTAPHAGQTNPWSFSVGTDVQAPDLFHPAVTDQVLGIWPPTVYAVVSDNQAVERVELVYSVNGGGDQGPVLLVNNSDSWELDFPLDQSGISVGDIITYQVQAFDVATNPNISVAGPFEFRVLENLGHVLIIDDLEAKKDGNKAEVPVDPSQKNLALDFQTWLTEAGYSVGVVSAGSLTAALLEAADVAFLTSGNNLYPVGDSSMRSQLIVYANNGGKILIEGGETLATCYNNQWQYGDFAASVLHADNFGGDLIGPMVVEPGLEQHPFMTRPNLLPPVVEQDMSPSPYDFYSSDIIVPDNESLLILKSTYNSDVGGILLHDNNTGPEAGQIVYMSIDLGYMPEAMSRLLLENSLAYLLSREAPGQASISGTVTLSGSPDASGISVSLDDEHSVVTGANGYFLLDGLHGSTYTLTASYPGYGSETLTVELAAEDNLSGLQLVLTQATLVQLTDSPELSIPDNNSTGLVREIMVSAAGQVQDISVDINITHASMGHLEVRLTSPQGTTVMLHDNSGGIADNLIGNWPANLVVSGPGTLDDFLAEGAQGLWQMQVADTNWGAMGTWHSWGLNMSVASVVSAAGDNMPAVTRLVGNTPNPFNPRTTVVFELARAGRTEMAIYNLRGQVVQTFASEVYPPGRHEILWDGRDSGGRDVSSGVYFFRLTADSESFVNKMILVR